MDGQIDLFDYLKASPEHEVEKGCVPAIGEDFQSPSAMDEVDKAKDQFFDSSLNELEPFIKDGFTILQQPFCFPDGLKTKWQPVELLLLENGNLITCSESYKDMTFRRSEHVKATLVGWKQVNKYE